MLEDAADDHELTRGTRTALTLSTLAPEHTSAALRCRRTRQQSVPTQFAAFVYPESATRVAISRCRQHGGMVQREVPRTGFDVARRWAILGFAHETPPILMTSSIESWNAAARQTRKLLKVRRFKALPAIRCGQPYARRDFGQERIGGTQSEAPDNRPRSTSLDLLLMHSRAGE